MGNELPQVAPFRAFKHSRQGVPGLAGLHVGRQRWFLPNRHAQRFHALPQHLQRVLPRRLLGLGAGFQTHHRCPLGQVRQLAHDGAHALLERIPLGHVAASAYLELRHPGAQALLGGRQLHKALVNIAGDAATHHLPLGLASGQHRSHRLQHHGGGQQNQHQTESSTKHADIVRALLLPRRRSSGVHVPVRRCSSAVQPRFK